jgi:hypothetical protein
MRVTQSVVSNGKPTRIGSVARQVVGEGRQHRMVGHRQAECGDPRPHRLEPAVVERDAVEVRANADAHHAGRVLDAFELDQRGLDVGQGQGGEAAHPVGIAAIARDDRVIQAARELDARLRLKHVDARRVHRQDRDVDALPVHLADQMIGIEHLGAERQPGLAVLEQIAEAVRVGLHRHAGQRAKCIEEDFLDLMGVNVDFHAGVNDRLELSGGLRGKRAKHACLALFRHDCACGLGGSALRADSGARTRDYRG